MNELHEHISQRECSVKNIKFSSRSIEWEIKPCKIITYFYYQITYEVIVKNIHVNDK